MKKSLKRSIHHGQKFVAASKGKTAVWEVTKRIKTDARNEVYCKVVHGVPQTKKYTGKQFGMLIGMGIIRLVKE